MKKIFLSFLLLFLFFSSIVFAVDFIPQNNITGRNVSEIRDFKSINAITFWQNGYQVLDTRDLGADKNNYTTAIYSNASVGNQIINLSRFGMIDLTLTLDLSRFNDSSLVSSLSSRVDLINSTAVNNTNFISYLMTANNSANGRIDTLNATVVNNTNYISYLILTNNSLDARVTVVNSTVVNHTNYISYLIIANNTMDARITALNSSKASTGVANCTGTDQVTGITLNANGAPSLACLAQGSGGGMSSWVLSNASITQTITDSNEVNIIAGSGISVSQNGYNLTLNSTASSGFANDTNIRVTTFGVTSPPSICSVTDTFVRFWNGTNSICTAPSDNYVTQIYGNATYYLKSNPLNYINTSTGNTTYYLSTNPNNYASGTSNLTLSDVAMGLGNWTNDKFNYTSLVYANSTFALNVSLQVEHGRIDNVNTTLNIQTLGFYNSTYSNSLYVQNYSNPNFTNIYTSNSGRITSNSTCSVLMYASTGSLRFAIC